MDKEGLFANQKIDFVQLYHEINRKTSSGACLLLLKEFRHSSGKDLVKQKTVLTQTRKLCYAIHMRNLNAEMSKRDFDKKNSKKILTEVQFTDRKEALQNKTKLNKLKRFYLLLQPTTRPHRI